MENHKENPNVTPRVEIKIIGTGEQVRKEALALLGLSETVASATKSIEATGAAIDNYFAQLNEKIVTENAGLDDEDKPEPKKKSTSRKSTKSKTEEPKPDAHEI